MSEMDIVERLLDFERCGLTAEDRVNMRECAAIEIHKLRQQKPKLPVWQELHLGLLLGRLSDWRNADHEDAITLYRSDVIAIIDGFKSLKGPAPDHRTPATYGDSVEFILNDDAHPSSPKSEVQK